MWVPFGVMTLLLSFVVSWIWRYSASWAGIQQQLGDTPFETDYTRKKRYSRWRMGIAALDAPEFQLKPETAHDRYFRRLGISNEVQTRDQAFDARIYVAADHLLIRHALRFKPRLRKQILRVLDVLQTMGWQFKELRLANDRLWVEVHAARDSEPPEPERMLPMLLQLRGLLPAASGKARHDRFVARAALVLALSTGIAISGALQLFDSNKTRFPQLLDASGLIGWSAGIGLLLGGGLIVSAMVWLKRSARSHLVLIELLLTGVFGVWAWSFTTLRDWNMQADRSPVVQVDRAVVSRYTSRSWAGKRRRRTNHYLTFAAEPEHALPALRLAVGESQYQAVQHGSCIRFELRQGALGWPWWVDMQLQTQRRSSCTS